MIDKREAQIHEEVRRRSILKKKMKRNEKTTRNERSLYLNKATSESRHDALLDETMLNLIDERLD